MLYVSERNRLILHWKLLADGDLLFWHFFFLFWRVLLSLITFKKKFLLALVEYTRRHRRFGMTDDQSAPPPAY
jgi:hypothetical protein